MVNSASKKRPAEIFRRSFGLGVVSGRFDLRRSTCGEHFGLLVDACEDVVAHSGRKMARELFAHGGEGGWDGGHDLLEQDVGRPFGDE